MKQKSNLLYFIFSIVLILLNLFLFFSEGVTINEVLIKNPYSYNSLLEKEETIKNLQDAYTSNETNIVLKNDELKIQELNVEKINQKEGELGLYDTNLKIHIPSLLVLLEQNANYYKLDLEIFYDLMFTSSDLLSAETLDPAEESGQIDGVEQPEEKAEPTNAKPDEKNDAKGETGIAGDEENNQEKAMIETVDSIKADLSMSPQELQVTVLPIMLIGDYENIREYISLIEEVDLVEPRNIQITSFGTEAEATIMIYIFSQQ